MLECINEAVNLVAKYRRQNRGARILWRFMKLPMHCEIITSGSVHRTTGRHLVPFRSLASRRSNAAHTDTAVMTNRSHTSYSCALFCPFFLSVTLPTRCICSHSQSRYYSSCFTYSLRVHFFNGKFL